MEMLDENILSDARTQLKVLNRSFHSIPSRSIEFRAFIPDFHKLHGM